MRHFIHLASSVAVTLIQGAFGRPTEQVGFATSGYVQQAYYPPAANCAEFFVPVSVAPEVVQFKFPRWANDPELVDFLAVATSRQTPNTQSPIGDTIKQNATFQIAASFCSPKDASDRAKTVILATHGIGQARSHWNSPFRPEEFNFVQFAISQGYSVFFYDRVGQGSSQKISGFENQININVEVLKELSKIVRSGAVTHAIGKPEKIALMGYSFGSYITHAAVGSSPEIADAVVLTAIGLNQTSVNVNGLVRSFVPRIANQQDRKFGDFDNGYLTWADKSVQINTSASPPVESI